jgi:3-hydroxyacyl-CoA dehydrogenase
MSTLSPAVPKFETVGCIGLGLMGHGIAQAAAQSDFKVIAFEQEQRFLDSGRSRIEGSLGKMLKREKISQEKYDQIMGNITYSTNMDDLKDTDLVVEAVIENMDLKKDIYGSLGSICKPEAIFASNTSSLSITDMANVSGRPERFVGVHFFNPVQMMKLVEVIRTEHTHPDVFDASKAWVGDINKIAVSCNDTPGFIVNRLLVPFLTQALLMVDRNDASIKDIDISMQLGAGHPMGPLHLADFIGLDTINNIITGWVEEFPNEPAFVVPKCLSDKIKAGDLGRKTGKGFYHWGEGDKRGDPVE